MQKDFRMTILEEVETAYLEEKEQQYFKKLLPSFFGFNQLNSFLRSLNIHFSRPELSDSVIDSYLSVLLEDIKGIYSYYEYGFTRFNFEHSFPMSFNFLLEEKDLLKKETLLKCDEVKFKSDELYKRYSSVHEETETERLDKNQNLLWEDWKIANNECEDLLALLEQEMEKRFRKLKFYSLGAITNFINSIIDKDNLKYKKSFYKYLKSKKCNVNFYDLFDNQIKAVNQKLEKRNSKKAVYEAAYALWKESYKNSIHKRYKMIFPSCQFQPFSLKDRGNDLSIKLNEEYDLLNTCHIRIYISNNGNNRGEIIKNPDIIRIDYCYIDKEGNKIENQYYIDNETTQNSQSGIYYFEKYYYNLFAIKPPRFKISGIIDDERYDSFISVEAEFKHGINDYKIIDKDLYELLVVLDEIQQLTDEETRFNTYVSESTNCLEKCLIIKLRKIGFVEKLLTKKLPTIKNKSKSLIMKADKVVDKLREQDDDKNNINERNKVTRAEAYKHKVLERSNNTVKVINYVSSKEKVKAQCISCGYEWQIRSDHLLRRPYCPLCGRK